MDSSAPIGVPDLPAVIESRQLRGPSHFEMSDLIARIASGHDVRIVSLHGTRRRLGFRDHLRVAVEGDPMSLRDFWHDVGEVLEAPPGKVERAFEWLVALTD